MREVVSFFPIRQCHPRHFARFYQRVFAIVLLAASLAFPLKAQRNTWKLIQTFNTSIGCGYFFDQDHGLIGTGVRWEGKQPGTPCAIYKTTDGGATWIASLVPVSIDGAVTSICMQDSLVGFASIFPSLNYSVGRTFGRSSLWQTTDGGSTWFDPFHLDHVISSVYSQNGLMMFTKWDFVEYSATPAPPDTKGADYSYDGGVTWTPAFRWCSGIAFSDSLNGVVTEMNQQTPGRNFWVTMDAGRTWQMTTNQYESWSVMAIPGKHIFLCANESQPNLPYVYINWSTDGGSNWSRRGSFPDIHFTGTIAGVGKTLYIQTDSGGLWSYLDANNYQHGMYRSDDTGATWHFINGPSNSRDTRFVVTGCMGQVVYAFDGLGGVYKTDDGGDGTLTGSFALGADTIQWQPNPCGDTLPLSITGLNCIPITIDSVIVPGTSEFLRLPNDSTLPQTLATTDSAKILLLYTPTKSGKTVSEVTVYAHSGENAITKVLTIVTQNSLMSTLALSKDTCMMNAGACAIVDDTVLLSDVGCPGMVLDSVTLTSGEISILNSFPDSVWDSIAYPLRFVFDPDSSGVHNLVANLYAHVGHRVYDTTISIVAQSIQPPVQFILDSTGITLGTKYCQPLTSVLGILTNACDTLVFDSIVSSNASFTLVNAPSMLAPQVADSLGIIFNPDSAGAYSGAVHIFAHGRTGHCDTTIFLSASNFALPQAATLSDTALTLVTSGCQSLFDTLVFGNQGCGLLSLDSVIVGDDSEISVSYDSTRLPLASDSILPFRIVYNPMDGITKTVTLRLLAHTPSRAIDTTISLAVSNAIPAEPLALSSDSLFLFTKYCQPVSIPFQIGNLWCQKMTFDSVIISGDTLREFSLNGLTDSIHAGTSISSSITFIPDRPGTRILEARCYLHENGKAIDTTLEIAAINLTAPAPYIPTLPALAAGQVLEIPIMLAPTTDTFSIHAYAFHLSFNTDLLTPSGLDFTGTCAEHIDSSKWIAEPGNGVSVRIWLNDTISDASQIALPLVYVKAKVALTVDTMTQVVLDSFATDREPTLGLCSIPEQPFTFAPACGDPLILDALRSEPISFSFISVAPNPASTGNWDVDYIAHATRAGLTLDVYNAAGSFVSHIGELPSTVGEHHATIPIPPASGDYFLVLGNNLEKTARKGSVNR